ncbi:E3 ubiquitin-protein ligase Topors [Mixophyes fleayi]|uniref:E3 ubiquitin-protein ligase Topors n=1 Tax=Mixophyes fleayi TaxID=3061075 RepID=UPI003F4E1D93
MLRGNDLTPGHQSSTMREKRSKRRRAGWREEALGMMMSSTPDNFTVDDNFSPTAGTSRLQIRGAPADASPDSKCPICLDKFDNVAHLNQCLHRFCFKCIKEWAKNKAVCPLCKQPFNSIFHSVQAEDDFKEYVLRPTLNGSPVGPRFRYRTTRTNDNPLPLRSLRSSTQRTCSLPDNGILFEGISNLPSQQRGSDIHQMMRKLASRRQASAEGRAMRQIQEQELINFRRALYRSGIRVRNIQDGGRYRDISAEFFRRNPACLHRLVPWLKRELTVLFGTHGSLVNIVQHIVMSNVTRYDMESQAFAEELQPFLLHRINHFLHEFINFARCPYNIEAFDQHANYDCPAPSYEEGSQSESSVITISPDEANSREPDVPSSSLAVGQAPWDDETPGPSYFTLDQATTSILTTVDSSDEEPSSSRLATKNVQNKSSEGMQDQVLPSDECVIVGYVKPLAERTPELVELSSDSEGSLCEVPIEQTSKPQLKPFALLDSSESRSSSSLSSSASSDKHARTIEHKLDTSREKKHSKKQKERMAKDMLSKNVHESRKYKGQSHNKEKSRRRARSQSSDCCSRSSRNRAYENRSRRHSKNSLSSKTLEKSRHKNWWEKRRSKSRDRSLSWRSQTVSLTSESSRERGGASSISKNRSRGRSRSRDSDNYFPADNYRSTYQWEYTYYSRNRDRDGYEQYYRTRACSRGRYSRRSASPEYSMQSYSERKDSKRQKGVTTGKAHHRYRSRSRSSSRMNTSGAQHIQSDKPSGKRKYKTRHLETQEKKESNRQVEVDNGKEKCMQASMSSTARNSGGYKDDLIETSSNEPKQKWKKKTRSPSVEIVYEGKSVQGGKHHKKKKKHKKKRKRDRREQPASYPAASPIIITIDSDSDTTMLEDSFCNDSSTILPDENPSLDTTMAVPSQSPATSATVSTTKPVNVEESGPYSKGYDLFSSYGHLDAATGILDGLHFDDSSDEPALPTTSSSPKVESSSEEAAMAEMPASHCHAQTSSLTSTIPIVITDSQESFAESSQDTFAQTITDALEI